MRHDAGLGRREVVGRNDQQRLGACAFGRARELGSRGGVVAAGIDQMRCDDRMHAAAARFAGLEMHPLQYAGAGRISHIPHGDLVGADRAGQQGRIELADVDPVDQGPATGHVEQPRHPVDQPTVDQTSVDVSRREFLVRCCRGASAALLPARLGGFAFPLGSLHVTSTGGDVDFHLHPHYRAQMPLDATLLKTQTGLDAFVTEKYQDQVAAILAQWRSSVLESPLNLQAVENVLTQRSIVLGTGNWKRGIKGRARRP